MLPDLQSIHISFLVRAFLEFCIQYKLLSMFMSLTLYPLNCLFLQIISVVSFEIEILQKWVIWQKFLLQLLMNHNSTWFHYYWYTICNQRIIKNHDKFEKKMVKNNELSHFLFFRYSRLEQNHIEEVPPRAFVGYKRLRRM